MDHEQPPGHGHPWAEPDAKTARQHALPCSLRCGDTPGDGARRAVAQCRPGQDQGREVPPRARGMTENGSARMRGQKLNLTPA
jgi:hypothetical protein